MIKQGKGGKLIGACSITGYRPSGKAPAYCTSKWAVRGITQTAALEFGQYSITVNAYCPGSIKTNMSMAFAEKLVKNQEQMGKVTMSVEETYLSSGHRKNALNKELSPKDMAGSISFLAGKDSSGMTGQTIIFYDGK
jgi:meso-butanediol dehydrogenase/(S,S)-butanediol dehydrogenase/diacetyl reductase